MPNTTVDKITPKYMKDNESYKKDLSKSMNREMWTDLSEILRNYENHTLLLQIVQNISFLTYVKVGGKYS